MGCRAGVSVGEAHLVARLERRLSSEGTPTASESVTEVALAARRFELSVLQLVFGDCSFKQLLLPACAIIAGLARHDTVLISGKLRSHSVDGLLVHHQGVLVDLVGFRGGQVCPRVVASGGRGSRGLLTILQRGATGLERWLSCDESSTALGCESRV